MTFEIRQLQSLLRRPANDVDVVALIGLDPSIIVRSAHYGAVEIKDDGVELVLIEAPWVVPPSEISDPMILYVCAFHFYRENHEGYSDYSGQLPKGITFNESEADVVRKLGPPLTTGGGGFSRLLNRSIPRWIKYSLGDAILHIQLDSDGKVEMVTLDSERIK